MTAVLPIAATGRPIAVPTPAAVAAAITRAQAQRAVLAVVGLPPAPTPAGIPHKRRLPSEPIEGEPAAVARDRAHWVDCNHGRHVWTDLPEHLGAPVCLHCPTRADQTDRIHAHRRTLAGRP